MTTEKHKRRRLQFSLQTLLVFVVVLRVPLGWFASKMRKARRQREAVAAIVKTGATVHYDFEHDETENLIEGTPPGSSWLRDLIGKDLFGDVVTVYAAETEFGDHEAVHLRVLPNVEWLVFDSTQITDKGLARLGRMNNLKVLMLGSTQVTDSSLACVKGMPALERLSLDSTQITDAGLAHLTALTRLEELSLVGTSITDNGLVHLKRFTRLGSLWLDGTHATLEGFHRLQQVLPNCDISITVLDW